MNRTASIILSVAFWCVAGPAQGQPIEPPPPPGGETAPAKEAPPAPGAEEAAGGGAAASEGVGGESDQPAPSSGEEGAPADAEAPAAPAENGSAPSAGGEAAASADEAQASTDGASASSGEAAPSNDEAWAATAAPERPGEAAVSDLQTVDEGPAPDPFWDDNWHFGVQLDGVIASTELGSSQYVAPGMGQYADNSAFGYAYGFGLRLVVLSPWEVRLAAGVGGLYDQGSYSDIPTGVALYPTISMTGHAIAAVVPITVGYQFRFWHDRFAVTADTGVEVVPWAGLVYSLDTPIPGAGGSELMVPRDVSVGWIGRIGFAWHVVPSFALTAELTGRYLRTRELVLHENRNFIVTVANEPLDLRFTGIGCQMGFTAYFF